VPANPDTVMWQEVQPWVAERRTRPDLVKLQGDLETWARAKGLYG
jgi:hypothetical protein